MKFAGAIGYRFVFDASNPNEVQKDESKINEFVIKGSNKGTITGFDPGEVYKVSVYSINFNEKESKTSPEKPMTTSLLIVLKKCGYCYFDYYKTL